MSDNYKNKLQEWFQRNKKNLPKYEHEQTESLSWISSLTINIGDETKSYRSVPNSTKIDADKECAEAAYKDICLKKESTIVFDKQKVSFVIWIDLDNCMDIYKYLVEHNCTQFLIKGFGGINIDKDKLPMANNICIETATIHKKDIADYMLIYDMITFMQNNFNHNKTYLVISKDASLENMSYVLSRDYPKINIKFIATKQGLSSIVSQ